MTKWLAASNSCAYFRSATCADERWFIFRSMRISLSLLACIVYALLLRRPAACCFRLSSNLDFKTGLHTTSSRYWASARRALLLLRAKQFTRSPTLTPRSFTLRPAPLLFVRLRYLLIRSIISMTRRFLVTAPSTNHFELFLHMLQMVWGCCIKMRLVSRREILSAPPAFRYALSLFDEKKFQHLRPTFNAD